MYGKSTRRGFMKKSSAAAMSLAASAVGLSQHAAAQKKRSYGISLAAWSLHRTIGEGPGKRAMLDMPQMAREEWDFDAIELVNNMLLTWEKPYFDRLIKNAADQNVKILLIMVDGQGRIGGDTEEKRAEAVKKHSFWIDVAGDMGCHSIRMNWSGAARNVAEKPEELKAFIGRSVPGIRTLCDYGDKKNINVTIENHGGASSVPSALKKLIAAVDHERFGTLPDFGGFSRNDDRSFKIDIYDAIDLLMTDAKAVSAKCYDFDDQTGLETTLDYPRLIEIVADKHDYTGYIGVEYEGRRQGEFDGIRACNELLKKLRTA
jgi:sugar phosphate isomerase/epimerase